MLANQICMYTCKSCSIVGELASPPMEGKGYFVIIPFAFTTNKLIIE